MAGNDGWKRWLETMAGNDGWKRCNHPPQRCNLTKKALQPSTIVLQPSREQRFRPVFTVVPAIYDPDDDVDRRRSGEERPAGGRRPLPPPYRAREPRRSRGSLASHRATPGAQDVPKLSLALGFYLWVHLPPRA